MGSKLHLVVDTLGHPFALRGLTRTADSKSQSPNGVVGTTYLRVPP